MRDRYYVHVSCIIKPWQNALTEIWRLARRYPAATPQSHWETNCRLMLEQHNIVVNSQKNGVIKLGFKSRGDMLIFAIRYS